VALVALVTLAATGLVRLIVLSVPLLALETQVTQTRKLNELTLSSSTHPTLDCSLVLTATPPAARSIRCGAEAFSRPRPLRAFFRPISNNNNNIIIIIHGGFTIVLLLLFPFPIPEPQDMSRVLYSTW
jgi:hypothetical protein